jgi:signal transduction histidine kinase
MFLLILLVIAVSLFLWIFRCYVVSLYIYLLARFERKRIDFQLLSLLRDDLVHERKKKMAGLEMMLSSWERGDEIQPRYEYFEELLDQLKNLVREGRRNLMAVTKDVWLWGKLWSMLRRIEKTCREKRERVEIRELRNELNQIQNLIDQVVESATYQFSFTLNQVVSESVKIVRIEKSHIKNIQIYEQLDDAGNTIRFSYDKFKDWQRILTNLIRNAVEAVETKQRGEGVASCFSVRGGGQTVVADLGLPGGKEIGWVKISTKPSEADIGRARVRDLRESDSPSLRRQGSQPCKEVSVIIEDSGIGMDEITRSSFYKKGFTFGKEGGLGLGVSEESVQFINQYGNWQIESQKGVGTKITINIDQEKARKDQLILPKEKPFLRTKLGYAFSFFLLVLIGLALLFIFDKYSRFWEDWNPAYAEAEEKHLLVYNKIHKLLWDVILPARIRPMIGAEKPLVQIADLDDDGKDEVIVGISFDERNTGKVICFNYKSEKLWEFACGDDSVYITPDGPNSRYFCPNLIEAEDLNGDSEKEVIINSREVRWFPNQLAILDEKGNRKLEYWHPGIMECLFCMDFDNDGEKEIILGGINNRIGWRPVISVLNSEKVFGQAMPYIAIKKLERAQEKWYIVFPHIKKRLPNESEWEKLLPAVNGMQILSKENRMDVYVNDGRMYSLELNFGLRYIYLHLGGYQKWKVDRQFSADLTKEDSLSWENIEVWKDGLKIK